MNSKPHVVIVGAGFGGLEAAKKLACKDVQVTVIDRTNYHLFQPLLYQVATAALSPADIAAPVRAVLSRCKNVEVILAEVESVDVDAKKVKTVDLEIDYDYLILATGARHSYFGHNDWEKLAPGLKSHEDAIELRRRILLAFEYTGKTLGAPVDRVGRVIVNDDLTVPGHPEVQVIGDLANFPHQTGQPLPGISPVAMQEGRHAARNVLAMIQGRKPQPFRYWDKGTMATIGRNKAVADLKFVHLSGLPAWLAWLFVHIVFLVGFRNRLLVLLQWAWAYLTFDKGARLITRNFQAEQRPPA